MMPNREGLFHAYPAAIGLGETRENKLLQVVIQYRLFEEFVPNQPADQGGPWVDCSASSFEITGYHILERRDHSLNESAIEALKAALGWDGRDPFWLQDNAAALADRPVQVKLVFEEYNGQQTLKVAFLNPYGSKAGGVPKADDDFRRATANRLGAKFRATAGGTPAPAPLPAGRPTPPTPTQSAPPAQRPAPAPAPAAPPAPATATMEQAWEAFVGRCQPPKWTQEATELEWFRILGELFPGRQPDALTGADWAVMLAEGPGKVIPF